MKQEEKDLLLVDLCARLPHGVRGVYKTSGIEIASQKLTYDIIGNLEYKNNVEFKPYLFPLSSMTEEQYEMYKEYRMTEYWKMRHSALSVEWLNKNNFDYRGLIGRGLAIDCTNLNIY